MTVSAGVHATAAAIAYILRAPAAITTCDTLAMKPTSTVAVAATATAAAVSRPDSRAGSTLRALTLMDCPALPPMAILEALSVVLKVDSGGGGGVGDREGNLEHVALGYSSAPPAELSPADGAASTRYDGGSDYLRRRRAPPPPPPVAVSHAVGHLGDDAGEGLDSSRNRASIEGEPAGVFSASGGEGDGAGGGGGCGESERGRNEEEWLDEVFEEGRVTLFGSAVLGSLTVSGESGLTGLVVGRCPRLRRLEVVRCRRLR